MSLTGADHLLGLQGPRLELDREHSVVEFSVRAFWGFHTIHGRFDRVDGSYTATPGGGMLELTVDVRSIDAGGLNDGIRAAITHAVADDPLMRFSSTRVVDPGDGTLRVVGKVEAAGEAHEVEFVATKRVLGGAVEIEYNTTVDRFSAEIPDELGMVRPPAKLHVRARFA